MLGRSLILPMIWSNFPLARLCNCSVIGASGSIEALGIGPLASLGWSSAAGATFFNGIGPVSPSEPAGFSIAGSEESVSAGGPTVSMFGAGLLASTTALVGPGAQSQQ